MSRLIGMAVFVLAAGVLSPSSRAGVITYQAFLSGPAEAPPNASPGTGFGLVEIDVVAHTLRVQTSFSGLLGNTTVAHIHAPTAQPLTGTAGVATQTPTFLGFPAGVTEGSYDRTFDLTQASSFNAAFITAQGGTVAAAEAAFAAALASGRAYLNIHTNLFPAGEIRGFLVAQVAPEPTTLGLLGVGCLGLIGYARRRAPQARA